jgi:hypothetical protein
MNQRPASTVLNATIRLLTALLLAGAGVSLAATHYVDANSTTATPPYTNWSTAATNIQEAVYASLAGDEIVVTNGTYAGGIFISELVTVRSVNGPQFTSIAGGGPCVILADNASLSGFTLTNGSAFGGMCPRYGGGAYGGTLNNCTLSDNTALGSYNGPGCSGSGGGYGGGAYYCTLNNCTLTGNSANGGGGAAYSTLNNCTLSDNTTPFAPVSNPGSGGATYSCTLNNCTLTGNYSADHGGGASSSTLNNCILYFNSAPQGSNYDSASTLNYCCTTPQPANGLGNISLDPQLASASHLSAGSPCRGAGNTAYARGTDIDGEAWASPPSMGCDEYHAGAVTGPLSVAVTATFTNVAVGFPVGFGALIEGRTTDSVWEFGDGLVEINQPYPKHTWAAPGDYLVALWAFNDSNPHGISATLIVHVLEGVHYVAVNNTNPVAPYTSWATAATNIQDAVDAATEPGSLVLVTNGMYASGRRTVGYATNRVAVVNLLSVRSVNGPQLTVIDGGQSLRCVYLTNGASLFGFTLTNGYNAGPNGGGGAFGGTLNNCTLSGNSDEFNGGGAWGCTLNNCTLAGNSANSEGGGAAFSKLNNCTLIGNSATNSGGGAAYSALNNCIVYFNTAPQAANYDPYSGLNYCCTTPQPTNGFGNITNAPLFVDTNGWANLHLQSNSPCINAGNNAPAPAGPDLDGNPRIEGGTVDIGAYEFQSPASIVSYAWLQEYGLPTDGSADFADPDHDGMNNWQEWRCRTDPTNALSVLRTLAPTATSTNVMITWQSVAGVNYFLERSTNLGPRFGFTSLATDILGQPGTTSFADTNAAGSGSFFYRVGVRN